MRWVLPTCWSLEFPLNGYWHNGVWDLCDGDVPFSSIGVELNAFCSSDVASIPDRWDISQPKQLRMVLPLSENWSDSVGIESMLVVCDHLALALATCAEHMWPSVHNKTEHRHQTELLSLKLWLSWNLMCAGSAGPYTVRIACGSSVETYDPNGYVWQKDWGFTGGSSAPLTFPNPKAPQIITLRYFSKFDGPENCYNITVPTGRYLIRYNKHLLSSLCPPAALT